MSSHLNAYGAALSLLSTVVLWLTFERWLIGLIPASLFVYFLLQQPKLQKRRYLALCSGLIPLIVAPINSDTSIRHVLFVIPFYALSVYLPRLVLMRSEPELLKIRWLPKRFRWSDLAYVSFTIPGSALGLWWYLSYVNPEVVYNWPLDTSTPVKTLVMLFIGMYLAGLWDEIFGQNTALAIFETQFRFPWANLFAMIIYAAALWDLAFRGWGFLVMFPFILSQGILWQRSRTLFWVLVVHFSLEVVLYILIVQSRFPNIRFGLF